MNKYIYLGHLALGFYRCLHKATNPINVFTSVQITRLVNKYMDKSKQYSILDVGCGTQPYKSLLLSILPRSFYQGVDSYPCDQSVISASAVNLPFPNDSIDILLSFDVLQHLQSPHTALGEAMRVLKVNGLMIMSYPFIYPECDMVDYCRWTKEGIIDILQMYSLETVEHIYRGGAFFCGLMSITSLIENSSPGSRVSFRSPRSKYYVMRSILLFIVTLPLKALAIFALLIDLLLPPNTLYLGGLIVAKRTEHL